MVSPRSVSELDDLLSSPSDEVINDLAADRGDLVIIGAGGKMGPSLCRLARRALTAAGRGNDTVHAVSRWSDAGAADGLRDAGINIVTTDISDTRQIQELPDAAQVVFMVGAKFGTSGSEHRTWSVNTLLPALIAQRYRDSAISAFSTGNVYPLVPIPDGGATEADPLGPVGEYAMSCLGRERALEHAASQGTRVAVLRLNYACDLRYGVLADIAAAVHVGRPVDVSTGHVNVVWQHYANEVALRALARATTSPFVINITGPETLSVRRVAQRFGDQFGTSVEISGVESPTALLSDATECHRLFGYPQVSAGQLIEWQADWIIRGLPMLEKPTKFQNRDGKF